MALEQIIKEKLEAGLDIASLIIENESHKHKGHAGDDGSGESHWHIHIISKDFDNRSRIACHRMVNEILADELKTRIHALSLSLQSLEERAKA